MTAPSLALALVVLEVATSPRTRESRLPDLPSKPLLRAALLATVAHYAPPKAKQPSPRATMLLVSQAVGEFNRFAVRYQAQGIDPTDADGGVRSAVLVAMALESLDGELTDVQRRQDARVKGGVPSSLLASRLLLLRSLESALVDYDRELREAIGARRHMAGAYHADKLGGAA